MKVIIKDKFTIVGIKKENKLLIGVSACSKNTDCDEKLGIQIAEGRANSRPFSILDLSSNSTKEFNSKFEIAANTILSYLTRQKKSTKEWGQKSLIKVA